MLRKLVARLQKMASVVRYWRGLYAEVYSPGHFYSSIPSQDAVAERLRDGALPNSEECPEIDLNENAQFERLRAFSSYYSEQPFPEEKHSGTRYFFDQSLFRYSDAIFLHCFLRHVRPARIIEVGSGFSSAAMLDTIDRFFPSRPQVTFIEPYPQRIKELLAPSDLQWCTLREEKVQDVPLETFESLQAGDLLFIDSSHVLKLGSDVEHLMFEVLPQLNEGVFVHFHDIFFPFEYPKQWTREGRFWNELYFVRSFLAHNSVWEIYFFNNFVGKKHRDFLAEHMPLCLQDLGGSLYLKKVSSHT